MQELLEQYQSVKAHDVLHWEKVGRISDFPENAGACIKYKTRQIAIFNFSDSSKWYACQNLCPHRLEMVLSRGMTGDILGIPKIACPLHKKTFSLEDGKSLEGEELKIAVYPVMIKQENVYIGFKD